MPSRTQTRPDRPSHLPLVAVLGVLWYLAGAAEYVLVRYATLADQLGWDPRLSVLFADGVPTWVSATWGIAVWGGLLGAILLLAREAVAPIILALAFIATVTLTVWLIWPAGAAFDAITISEGAWLMIGASVVSCLLWLYARSMRAHHVLG
jgi:hypothetical protein